MLAVLCLEESSHHEYGDPCNGRKDTQCCNIGDGLAFLLIRDYRSKGRHLCVIGLRYEEFVHVPFSFNVVIQTGMDHSQVEQVIPFIILITIQQLRKQKSGFLHIGLVRTSQETEGVIELALWGAMLIESVLVSLEIYYWSKLLFRSVLCFCCRPWKIVIAILPPSPRCWQCPQGSGSFLIKGWSQLQVKLAYIPLINKIMAKLNVQ